MKRRQPSFRVIAFASMSLLHATLHAKPPTPMTEAEIAAIQADAASRASVSREKAAAAEAALKSDLADDATASADVTTFLAKADLPPVKSDEPPAADAKPLEMPDDPQSTHISCDGGIYFDPEDGVLVYLKNVKVNNPRFNLEGANELKIFFGKKEPAPEKDKLAADGKKPTPATDPTEDKPETDAKKDKSDPGIGGDIGKDIGDVERIIATGAIRIDQKPADDKEPIQASGAIFTYNVKAGEATLSGGFPWVKQGANFIRSKSANNLLRIYPDESRFDTPGGGWDMRLIIPEKEQKKKR